MARKTKVDNAKLKREKQKAHRQERDLARNVAIIAEKETFLIICEGKNTEKEYFDGFRLTSATIKAIGTGYNTLSLIEYTEKFVELEKKKGNDFDQVWCVFDHDPKPDNPLQSQNFNNAIQKAQSLGYKVAYSNQAFEFWYLLHFNPYQGGMDRSEYDDRLNEHFKIFNVKYGKNKSKAKRMYSLLFSRQKEAIKNAKNAEKIFDKTVTPAKRESTTTVYKLVEELNRFNQ
ncbi:MAG: RloB family protein [Microscillaceae bacterium]|jgi:hypothetical protein|nr:RloB family protein [Microscillaceae bacterium]